MTDQAKRILDRAHARREAGDMAGYFKLILLAGEVKTIKDRL